jgi:hypothetical protein
LTVLEKETEFKLSHFKKEFEKMPMAIRNGLAIYYNLAHLVSTK